MNVLIAIPKGQVRDYLMDRELILKIQEKAEITWNDSTTQFAKDELAEKLKNADICITSWGTPRIDYDMVQNTPLKLIAHAAGSVTQVIDSNLLKNDIKIVSGNKGFAKALAEYTLTLILMSLRKSYYYCHSLKTKPGFWGSMDNLESELYGKKIGIIGYGSVARELIRLLKVFDVAILVCDDYCDEQEAEKAGFEIKPLKYAMVESDIVTVHHTLKPDTYHLIGQKELSFLKDGAIVINTARGKIIDQQAFISKLKTENIFAALDVFDIEPLSDKCILKEMDNVYIFPHMAGKTVECRKRIGIITLNEVLRFLEGEELLELIDVGIYNRMTVEMT